MNNTTYPDHLTDPAVTSAQLLPVLPHYGVQLRCVIQADCIVGKAGNVSVVLAPVLQEADDGVEEEQEYKEEDEDLLHTDTEG